MSLGLKARRPPTAADIARIAGVSKWTVIRAFKPDASISEDARTRVLKTAEEMGYRPNLLARSLATRTSHTIAVLVDDFTNLAKLPGLEALSRLAQANGLTATLINLNSGYDAVEALLHARQRQADGIVLFANTELQDTVLEEVEAHASSVPMVAFARETTIPGIPQVIVDAKASMREICEHLASRGYRRPGFMTGPASRATGVSRLRWFKEFWQEQGCNDLHILPAGSLDRKLAEKAMRVYLTATPPEQRVDVLMCECDVLAMGALDVARFEFGLKVPRDIAIAGYDNIEVAAASAYSLTTFEQPMEAMSEAAIAILKGERPAQTVVVPGKLFVRGST